ncbi:ribonuclease H-like domain-containing protein [Tanacetum coccineum]
MKKILMANGVWDLIEGTSTSKQTDVRKDSSASAYLFQRLPEDLQMQVAGCDTAKEIWDPLKSRFIGTEDIQQAHSQQLKSKFERLLMILTASSTSLLQRIISSLHVKFAMTDLGPLNYFLGISATRTTSGIFLSQKKYATKVLEQAQMLNSNPYRTPVDTEKKLGPEGSPVTDPTLYHSLSGSL